MLFLKIHPFKFFNKKLAFLSLKILFLTFLFWSKLSLATVGGPSVIQVLGWDEKYQYLILQLESQDEAGWTPDLYLYHLPSKTLTIMDMKIEADFSQYEAALTTLRARLKELQPLNLQENQLSFKIRTLKRGQDKYDPASPYEAAYRRYETQWVGILKNQKNLTSAIVKSYPAYRRTTELIAAYQIPEKKLQLFVVRYLGKNYEMGYTIDQVLFIPKPQSIQKVPPRFYTVQVGAFSSRANSEKLAELIRQQGYSPYILQTDPKAHVVYHRVRVGFYLLKEEAREIAKKLGKEARVITIEIKAEPL